MKGSTKILLIGAALGIGAAAVAYRNGINQLQFSIDGYQAGNGSELLMRIKVVNNSKLFGYPVPRMLVNVFDNTGSFIGTIINEQLQYIPANSQSFIYGIVAPNYANFFSIITNLVTGGSLPSGLVFHGIIKVGNLEIPFETTQGNAAIGNIDGVKLVPLYEDGNIEVGDVLVKRVKERVYKTTYFDGGVDGKLIPGSYKIKDTWYEVLKIYKSPSGLRMKIKDLTYGYTPAAIISEWINPGKGYETFKVVSSETV